MRDFTGNDCMTNPLQPVYQNFTFDMTLGGKDTCLRPTVKG